MDAQRVRVLLATIESELPLVKRAFESGSAFDVLRGVAWIGKVLRELRDLSTPPACEAHEREMIERVRVELLERVRALSAEGSETWARRAEA